MCTQPRRISATAVSARVADERGEALGWTLEITRKKLNYNQRSRCERRGCRREVWGLLFYSFFLRERVFSNQTLGHVLLGDPMLDGP